MIIYENDEDLVHIGTPRHSGRYPWGSGGDDNTDSRNRSLVQEINSLRKQGVPEKQIAVGLGFRNTTDLRIEEALAKNAVKQSKINMAVRLQAKGTSTNAIAKQMGEAEATVRGWLAPGAKERVDSLTATANMLKKEVAEKWLVDVGAGAELAPTIGLAPGRFSLAVGMLQKEGYKVHTFNSPNINRETQTKRRILCPPGTTQKEVWENQDKIQQIVNWSTDRGKNYTPVSPPLSIDSKRVGIRYREDGGDKADGVIYVRPGVKDVQLGGNSYAQVRIMVDGTHYIKGMAVYKNDLPPGPDIVFNTTKSNTGSKKDALKPIKADPTLPFGAIVRQIKDKDDGPPTSVMNIVNDEGDWVKWSKTLSSQFLSKQDPHLAKTQLDLTYEHSLHDFEKVKALTNPVVRKKMLMEFADTSDASAVHLKAASMPRQAIRVLLPLPTIKETEVYAPGFRSGERVVLIRHPHAGPFEIPELTVNNRHAEGKRLIGNGSTAIGIHSTVAKKLSGADFDGDTVLVIPNPHGRIKTQTALKELMDFDPVSAFPGFPGMKVIGDVQQQTEMGKISNLLTDMTIKGASHDKIIRAVKHSMVVIDADKGLDWKESYKQNGIKKLKEEYSTPTGGASTLISRKKTPIYLPERKARLYPRGGPINRETGEKEYEPTNRVYNPSHKKAGQIVERRFNALSEAKDAHTLSSGTPIENIYANHSNKLKALANEARLEAIRTPTGKYSSTANKVYKKEVDSLDSKLLIAERNAPLERQAQAIATSRIKLMRSYNPDLDKKTLKKLRTQEITDARNKTGAGKHRIEKITQEEWDAIQAGAISPTKLTKILRYADMKMIRQLATPKTQELMTPVATARAKAMFASGFDRGEIAQALGVSLSTLDAGIKVGDLNEE